MHKSGRFRRLALRFSLLGIFACVGAALARVNGALQYDWATICVATFAFLVVFLFASRASVVVKTRPAPAAVDAALAPFLHAITSPDEALWSRIGRLRFVCPRSWKAARASPSCWLFWPPGLGRPVEAMVWVTRRDESYQDTTFHGQTANLEEFLRRDGFGAPVALQRRVFGYAGLEATASARRRSVLVYFLSHEDADYQFRLLGGDQEHVALLRPLAEAFLACCSLEPRPLRDEQCVKGESDVLDLLVHSFTHRKAVVFCGAGISFDSGLPLARDLLREIATACGASEADAELITNSAIPFEAVMEAVYDNSDPGALLELFREGEPTAQHRLLSRLIARGFLDLVVTTNFDTLIESAFRAEHHAQTELRIVHAIQELESVAQHSGPQLVKIHGTVDDPAGMAMTIRQVAAQRLVRERESVLRYVFETGPHEVVFMVGYSGSDRFDILPGIRALEGPCKQLFWIDRHDDKRAHAVIEPLRGDHFGAKVSGFRICCDVRGFMERVGARVLREDLERMLVKPTWKEHLEMWTRGNERRVSFGDALLGRVLIDIGRPDCAIGYWRRAVQRARLASGTELGRCLVGLAGALRGCGASASAEKLLREAMALLVDVGERSNCLCDLGASMADQARFYDAFTVFEGGHELAREANDRTRAARNLGNLASCLGSLGRHREAVPYLEAAATIANEIGDKTSEGTSLVNLARIREILGDHESAVSCFDLGIGILEVALGAASPVVQRARCALVLSSADSGSTYASIAH